MSSNHLNYTLSKQLKELGVKFSSDQGQTVLMEEANGVKVWVHIPTTAQLIDEIERRGNGFILEASLGTFDICQGINNIIKTSRAPCCTTALGKSLIELVKNEKEKQ